MANYSLTGNQKKDGSKNKDIVTVKGNNNSFWAKAGADEITITSGDENYIYGEVGNDKIYIKKGYKNKAEGGAGTDTMEISGGTYNSVRGGAKKDILSVVGSASYSTVHGDEGNDSITINTNTKGKENYVCGDAGDDIINVKKAGAGLEIRGGAGQDTITVRGCSSWSIYGGESLGITGDKKDIINVYSGTGKIVAYDGDDEITVNKGVKNGIEILGEYGNDIITIKGGKEHEINGGNGQDTVKINAGTGHTITADFDDKITVKKGAGGTITIKGGNDLKTGFVDLKSGSSVALELGDRISTEKFTIKAAKGTVAGKQLIVNDDYSYWGESYTFKQSGKSLVINDKVYINNFDNGAFANGIKFEDVTLSVAQIKEKAGWK